jgi:hypothetical protein
VACTDPVSYRIVLLGITSSVLVCLVGAIALSLRGQEIPPGLLALAGTGMGALMGLLSPGPSVQLSSPGERVPPRAG